MDLVLVLDLVLGIQKTKAVVVVVVAAVVVVVVETVVAVEGIPGNVDADGQGRILLLVAKGTRRIVGEAEDRSCLQAVVVQRQ